MLSRLAIQSAARISAIRQPVLCNLSAVRGASSQDIPKTDSLGREVLVLPGEPPERDLVNFPRVKRPLYPGKVRLGFIPEEWFQFFYPKTGVTGPYLFGTGLVTYLYSKEILVMDHEFYVGVTMLVMIAFVSKKFGKQISDYLDKEVDAIEDEFKSGHNNLVNSLNEQIKQEKHAQWQAEGMNYLFDAKRENVALQLEAEFRARQMQVYNEVKRRLDYQIEVINIKRRMQQKHMVDWIVNNVRKSLTPQHEQEAIQKCIADLKGLAART